jgi:hypothetical protein
MSAIIAGMLNKQVSALEQIAFSAQLFSARPELLITDANDDSLFFLDGWLLIVDSFLPSHYYSDARADCDRVAAALMPQFH